MRNSGTVNGLSMRAFFLSAILAATVFAGGKTTLQELAAGPPTLMNDLGPLTFHEFKVERLAKPLVAYIDYDYFRSRGVSIPTEGIESPSLVKDIEESFAWMTHRPNDPAEAFLNIQRSLYAYYYGGYGLNGNIGSGRSAAFSDFDIKGLPTPLIQSKDTYHSNGAAITIEAVDEAIWGRILDAETNFGSNRVVAVIFTGTMIQVPGEEHRMAPRALIVREMGIRPAHHMLNSDRNAAEDRKRLAETTKNLLKNLPYPADFVAKDDADALRTGFLEGTRREAITQAEMFAKRLYFGSNSPSNLELKGRRLDLGDHTSVMSYTKIYRLDDESPFGETEEFKVVQEDFRKSLLATAPAHLKSAVPTHEEMVVHFDAAFTSQRAIEMLKLSGAPPELLTRASNNQTMKLAADKILEVAMAGNTKKVFMTHSTYENTSLYNLGRVLILLADNAHLPRAQLTQVLAQEIKSDLNLRSSLAQAYLNFRSEMTFLAKFKNIAQKNLDTYFREASRVRNRDRASLVRGDARWAELWSVTDRALRTMDGSITQKYIETQIANNQISFKDAKPFRLVLKQTKNAAEGWLEREELDLKSGERLKVTKLHIQDGKAVYKGITLTGDELKRFGPDGVSEARMFHATRTCQRFYEAYTIN